MSQETVQTTAAAAVNAAPAVINPRELRDAFGAFMTGVTIVTTTGEDGKPLGFTANSFSSVSLDPALLLVSIAKTSSNYQTFSTTGHFAINILAEGQKDLSNTFARPSDDRFANVDWNLSAIHNPLLDDVSAWFDCSTHAVIDAGDHALLVGKVEAFHSAGYAGLGYYRGGYFTPAKVSAEVIAGPKVIVSAIIARDDKVLLTRTADNKWGLPSQEIGKEGADKALAGIFGKYQPDASASFIYSAYNNTETHYQYIAFLCSAPDDAGDAVDASSRFVSLDDIEPDQFQDSAVASMLQRYRKESQLKSYGMYYGDHSNGTVRPLLS
ncbi:MULTISPECIES: flavin reductase [unclassified Paraburkholderia]|uniref:flavin reductase n=1 Tax=unclassified Paraburkholderia TaxID=2615204 RepID=UPI001980BBF6|nr:MULTISPECIES: flavin reductase family protein [unclassified Paraburkholderia]MBN3857118.1 flavin reductase [Paraburkholderia sp. Ac-20340]